MNDPDGIALLLIFGLLGLTALLIALGVEAWLARGMRQRQRAREALVRYCNTITEARP